MGIDAEEVRRIARLAHLEHPEGEEPLLDADALARLAADLDRILDHVRDLESVDVADVPPTSHGVALAPRTRPDAPGPVLSPDLALAAAPAREGDAFSVPKVVE